MRLGKLIAFTALVLLFSNCQKEINPLLTEWDTNFGSVPFEAIELQHFMPAFEEGIQHYEAEIKKIAENSEKATFENTIKALETSGELLWRTNRVFGVFNGANTNETLQNISKEISPRISRLNSDLYLNEALFQRVKTLYDSRESLILNEEELFVLDLTYKDFVHNGALLSSGNKEKLRQIKEELSHLYIKFRQNQLAETNKIILVIENESDLAGLPAEVREAAAELAKSKGMDKSWAINLQKPSFIPFLQYSERRDLREIVYKGYVNRGNNGDKYDCNEIIAKIASLRVALAQVMGYENYAQYQLTRRMAKTPQAVDDFLHKLWKPSLERAKNERDEMQAIIDKEGGNYKLAGWDWWHYAEKLRKEKYSIDETELRAYFPMEAVRQGAFDVAEKLYGIRFEPRKDLQVWHSDVEAFEVKEADGSHIGLFYSDYFARDSKRSGAWSGTIRQQSSIDGIEIRPHNYNVGNFSKPLGDSPALLSEDEIETLFHELGHGLNTLFADRIYPKARRVPQDFVELPSQILENWAFEPELMKSYSRHYQTGEPIPDELLEKLQQASLFNQGFITTEYLAASLLDMAWHSLSDTMVRDARQFEAEILAEIGLIPEIAPRYTSANFGHIFGGDGYSAGYYVYIWAAVLDSDAFAAFKEKGLFDQTLAQRFREYCLAGGAPDMMAQYRKFRGADPSIEALLIKRGLM